MTQRDRGTAYDGFSVLYDGTGNADAIVAQRCTVRVNVDYELVKQFQDHGGGVMRGKPLGRLPELWPFDQLKRPLIAEAEEFVRQVATQGYEAVTPVYEFEVWGPYTEKVGKPQDWVPEADNPYIPESEKQTATTAWLYAGNEIRIDMGCVFLIRGEFTRKASLGHVEEQRGILIV